MMPLRGARRLTLAMGLVSLALVLLATGSAADAEPRATDGRVLSGETLATQAMFYAVWGDRALGRRQLDGDGPAAKGGRR